MFQITSLDLDKVASTGKVDYSKDFFGRKVFMTVSGQIDEEPMTHAFCNTYTFGPTFRAEKSNTSRHAAEFWMMEPEMCFTDLSGLMDNEEEMVKYVIKYVLDNCKDELEFLNKFVDKELLERLNNVVNNDFVRLSYTEAVELLEKVKDKFEFPVYWGVDLQSEHERYLTEVVYKKPVFLYNYPKDIKAFYMKQNEDGKTVAAVDLLVPGIGELIGGSQREENYEKLTARMLELGLNLEEYKNYLDIRRYGTTTHSGYGLGFERLVMYLTGMTNIRDVEYCPRTVGNIQIIKYEKLKKIELMESLYLLILIFFIILITFPLGFKVKLFYSIKSNRGAIAIYFWKIKIKVIKAKFKGKQIYLVENHKKTEMEIELTEPQLKFLQFFKHFSFMLHY